MKLKKSTDNADHFNCVLFMGKSLSVLIELFRYVSILPKSLPFCNVGKQFRNPLRRIGQKQDGVGENVTAVCLPEGMEQKTADNAEQPQIEWKNIRFFMQVYKKKEQYAQIKDILVGITVGNQKITAGSGIQGFKKGGSSAVGGKGCLSGGIGAVCPLGKLFFQVKICSVAGVGFEESQTFLNCLTADGIGCFGIHAGKLIGFKIKAVVPAISPGCLLHPHGNIGAGGNTCAESAAGTMLIQLLGTGQNKQGTEGAAEAPEKQLALLIPDSVKGTDNQDGNYGNQGIFPHQYTEGEKKECAQSL